MRRAPILTAAIILLASGTIAAQEAPPLPGGVTPAMIATGETLYKSIGLCFACHGPDGAGIPGVGVNLTDEEWVHTDGDFQSLVQRILDGIGPGESKSGVIMPPRGGSQISDEQAKAIAGYVWSLSRLTAS